MKKPICLVIMDGFGIPTDEKRSGITRENTKNLQKLAYTYPTTKLEASEGAVGLPDGQMGTSEVGHLTMGIGRVVYQPIVEINRAIADGSFFKNRVLVDAMEYAKREDKAVHLLGLPTDGGIHSHISHLFAILKIAGNMGLKKVFIHYFTDGRDTPPKSALTYLEQIEEQIKLTGCGKVATVIGRFYALDRDKNYDRVEKAYNAMVLGLGDTSETPELAIKNAYNREETDEFISPTVITANGEPVGKIQNGDVVISYNFRTDREKELAQVFDPEFGLDYIDKNLKVRLVTMTVYDENFTHTEVAFPPKKNTHILSSVLSEGGYTQLKVAETEKFAHVTFFFNDGKNEEFKGETRKLINSIKMKRYASNPEMSAKAVADETIKGIQSGDYDVIVTNFANPDMVGHSGDKEATRKAIEVVDCEVQRVVNALLEAGGIMLLTADHGNADIMEYEDGSPCSSHTTALVPFFLIGEDVKNKKLKNSGTLADIAPTILNLLGERQPKVMSGQSLIEGEE